MALITCKNLSVGYEGKAVLSDLNFACNTQDYLCIVGENGSGKSTLMKTILRLQQPINGEIITGDGLCANQIGYLPQQSAIQKDFPASVREIVLSGCQAKKGLKPFYNQQDKKKADENMAKMSLTDLANRCYRELSGGQKQRVLLARALCASEKLLLLDEPVAGLDPKVSADMYELIKEINEKEGITIIMISHDMDAALKYASHILHIGSEVFYGTNEEYRNSEVGKKYLHRNGGE